jgi:acetyl esterase/lipase
MTMPNEWKLPPLVAGQPADEEILAYRAKVNAVIAGASILHEERPEVPRRSMKIGDVLCHEVGSPEASTTIIYLHGGGFRVGDPAAWVRYAADIAAETSSRVVLPDYRLAPEYPFPAALYDAATVFRALAEQRGNGRLIVMGESAGGTLTGALLVAAIQNDHKPLPDAAIMISPLLDFSLGSITYQTHAAVDTGVSLASAQQIRRCYVQNVRTNDPLVSPLEADVSKFPPTQIICGGHEVLVGDATAFARKLAESNCTVEAHFFAGMTHGWSFIQPKLPESQATRRQILRFIKEIAA